MSPGETAHRLVGGRYTLLEPLGQGGMGTVWRAHDELLRRQVAVKQVVVPPGPGEDERAAVRDRVMREAQAAARLSHGASVTVFDVLEEGGSVHIVMELLEADTLADVVGARGPMDADEAARLGLELVGALAAAHAEGIVHRDVKPGNVMLLPTGAVKLTDFGIASVKDDPRITARGQVLGSPAYMAPEQALGNPSGPEADWWGLGATLYFAVEGRPPFERPGGVLRTLTAVVHEDPAPTERAGPMAPVLDRLLAKDPARRPEASEVRELLKALTGSADPSRPAWQAWPVWDRSTGPPVTAGRPADRGAGDGPVDAAGAPPPSGPGRGGSPVAAGTDAVPGAARDRDAATPNRTARAGGGAKAAGSTERAGGRARAATGRTSRPPAVAALVVAVAVLAGLVAWSASRDGDGSGDDRSPGTAVGDGPVTSGNAATTAPAGVPPDWVAYTDPDIGYRISHPPAWRVRALDGTRTDFRDPDTGSYLRVDWTATPGPSPEGAWESLSRSFGARHDAYEEIRIDPTTYKGFDAALWEYAYTSGDARLHAANLGMVTGRYGFALNFQTVESRWASSQPLFEAFKASFQTPG